MMLPQYSSLPPSSQIRVILFLLMFVQTEKHGVVYQLLYLIGPPAVRVIISSEGPMGIQFSLFSVGGASR